ncbi:methyltransferase domain-containing protein [Amylocarpus encephaloides]|uniref:Methyltransferase domain-containing protein n=1 Tax=Amylocarpus encephaloides TaxID=45428 RepID=A0A9P8BZS5_9HELO|nr:methyltransferase domain-containing protein [Amylocarpus encephaloides]
MAPSRPIPYPDDFTTANEYADSLLEFSAASTIFQTLCGGVHILDFFTRTPSLYHKVIPEEWRSWLLAQDSMKLLDILMRDNLAKFENGGAGDTNQPPESFLRYIKDIRKRSLRRSLPQGKEEDTKLPRQVAVGMIPKKIHEVSRFADYVVRVADDASAASGKEITHFVDFGSGQNYLGRTLACQPYNKHIVAVESKELNINGAKRMDVFAGVGKREKVMRNKKAYRQIRDASTPIDEMKDKAKRRIVKSEPLVELEGVDLRPIRDLATLYTPSEGKGYMQYVEHIVQDGNLSNVVTQIERLKLEGPPGNLQITNSDADETSLPTVLDEIAKVEDVRLMAISIHSCGNLSHHGIRSLILNPSVQAIAIVGCCYNLLSSRLGPPTLKHPRIRRNMKAINAPQGEIKQLSDCDPHGFPMSQRLGTYGGDGVRLNITARMMGVQAPQNWTPKESDAFFTRHFYRALLQRLFLDYGVVSKFEETEGSPESTEPVIIGSLRKSCYGSFRRYVRGAIEKLKADPERSLNLDDKMGSITDEQLDEYGAKHGHLKKELSVTWSLMAFSAGVVESLIVVDRWLFLKEHSDIVSDCWVEPVFEYKQSPRNLVVVGIKR